MKKYNNLLEDITEQECIKQMKKNIFICLSVLTVSILIVIFGIYITKSKTVKEPVQSNITQYEKSLEQHIGEAILFPQKEINDSILYDYLTTINVWYPDILLAQAKIESASYSSNVFNKTNNLYGMKSVNSRFHCQTGLYNGYGCYDSWKLSVIDRVLWDLFVFDSIKPSREIYLKTLRNYAEAQNYIYTIQNVINSNNIEL